MRPLPPAFYRRPTLEVARDLLGRRLLVGGNGRLCGGRIVEVEAYIGEADPACHAHRGLTHRNRIMYGPPGRAYVYFTYGNHWMLNFVTEREGFPAAVLIRALEPELGLPAIRRRRRVSRDHDLTNGPGKLTAALRINGADNGASLQGPRLLVGGADDRDQAVARSGRIGVDAGADIPWRFYLADNPWVSHHHRGHTPTRNKACHDILIRQELPKCR
ncbi:MAG: DNA-3-methyladenine glycosylase [Candidatus Zixiibacteriota bacterium]